MNGARRPEDRWSEPYLLAVAAQLDWWFASDWHALQAVDPGLERPIRADAWRELAAPPLDPSGVPPFEREAGAEATDEDAAVARLRRDVTRVRAAGARAFAEPWLPLLELACRTGWPLRLAGVPGVAGADRDRVVLVELNDFPADSPAWRSRGLLAAYPAVESLEVQGNGLTGDIGIEAGTMPRLRILDLERNALLRLPGEVADCRTLEALLLSGNAELGPALDADLLAGLGPLRLLDLRATGTPAATVDALAEALPGCTIRS